MHCYSLLLLLAGLFTSCQYAPPETAEAVNLPTRDELQYKAWRSDRWLLVYADAEAGTAEAYEKLLSPLTQTVYRNRSLEVFAASQAPDSLLRNRPTIFVGRDWPEGWRERFSEVLPPVRLTERGFRLGDDFYDQRDEAILKLHFLPHPWNPQQPANLYTASSEALLLDYLRDLLADGARNLYRSGWGYELWQNRKVRMRGYFNDSTWRMDRRVHFSFAAEAVPIADLSAFSLQAFDEPRVDAEAARNILRRIDQRARNLAAFLGQAEVPALTVYTYPSVEMMGLRRQDMRQSQADEAAMAVHVVHNDHFQGEEWEDALRPLARHWLGEAAFPGLESGLCLYWCDHIRGRSWRHWAARLVQGGAFPGLSTVLRPGDGASEPISTLAAASFFDYLLQTWGRETLLSRYASWRPSETELLETERAWREWLATAYEPPRKREDAPMPNRMLNGFTFAHEGYRIYNGYGARQADTSLAMLRSLGANAVSIVPYSYLPSPRTPGPIPVVSGAGSENDEAVLYAHFAAQRRGLFTMLKPQIWISGSWPGEVSFANPTDWDVFFREYHAWLAHYALLAEMYGWDGLCIGTEFKAATLQFPERWRGLIRMARELYDGPLTYAANWGEECENLTFWPELDAVGVNCYYPLSDKPEAGQADLEAGVERVMERLAALHRASDRPIWLTEVGFRSAGEPWLSPHAEAEDRPIDEAAQARCYRVMLAAVAERDWIRGQFWWKWPSHLSHDEDEGRGYNPYRKPAADVVKAFWLENQPD